MADIRKISIEEFHAELRAQGASGKQHLAFRCPMCATVQSAASLMKAGAGENFEQVEKFLGFSCVGRFTNAGSPRRAPDDQPCNWTLGGLLRLHKLEVVDGDGECHPRFEVATAEEAAALETLNG
ncbi:hypothetical protein TAL182_CH01092 [Rhizobium sp. TAL182]|uniref:VVA0879 family protein n=1 Tax=Rhizobium sp. TAL182 TaxID=2020313 RepID=UPI000A21144C|nr:VVA0879 family protein [Rhizobium sp. TAL182]ARO22905.1 hypothetical protein TAL182_CH01092 [Rhizobium sp. TAL182]